MLLVIADSLTMTSIVVVVCLLLRLLLLQTLLLLLLLLLLLVLLLALLLHTSAYQPLIKQGIVTAVAKMLLLVIHHFPVDFLGHPIERSAEPCLW